MIIDYPNHRGTYVPRSGLFAVAIRLVFLFSCLTPLLCPVVLLAQDEKKKDEKKEEPQLKFSVPLAVPQEYSGKFNLRGLRLKDAKEVKSSAAGVEVKQVKAEAATPPQDVDAKIAGDSQVEIELKLTADVPAGEIPLTVVTDKGEATYQLLVVAKERYLEQKEPAGGFREAQELPLDRVVVGQIQSPRDVDVFKLELAAGQRIVAEAFAARRGSPCDPHLTIYDSRGRILAVNDDHNGTRDARLAFNPAAAGIYYLSLIDAHDLGSNLHGYALEVRPTKDGD